MYLLSHAAKLIGLFSILGHSAPPRDQTRLLGTSFGVAGINQTFDYVIVGGGTAGLTVAQRLAEDSQISVAVVEAGSFYELDNGNGSQVPGYDSSTQASLNNLPGFIDWGLTTEPQDGLMGRSLRYLQGKCFGGSSALNNMAYHRGTIGSFQLWADTVEDQGFEWDFIEPFYKKSVDFTPPGPGDTDSILYDSAAFTPTGGPLHVSYSNYQQPYGQSLAQGMSELGLQSILGLNSGVLNGFASCTATIDPQDESRSSSETSFLRTAIASSGLQVFQRTMAKQVIIDAEKRATGVMVEANGVLYTLEARKEVIVSAGAFHSPQLLMVSGIGPAATLQQYSIPVISDLPAVGQNLWDQPMLFLSYQVNVTTNSQLSDQAISAQAVESYLSDQTGPLTNIGGDLVGWEKLPPQYRANLSQTTLTALASFPSDWPELEILPFSNAPSPANASAGDNFMLIGAGLMATTSRGNVTIESTDTNDRPLINPRLLATIADQEVAVAAFKRIRQLAAATSIIIAETAPGDAVQSDAQILEYIQNTAALTYHASATCAMGPANDPAAVVDSHARVYGVSGLRVVDASAFPFLPPGHPQSTVYMLAEKIAFDIANGE